LRLWSKDSRDSRDSKDGRDKKAQPERPNYSLDEYSHHGYTRSMNEREEVDQLLPLPPATFHILLALLDEERHGYAIIQDVEARTEGELRLSAGTLYRSIARMVEQGLIAEVLKRRPAADDPRRRYYRLTPFGIEVARAEMRRLSQLVRLARARGLKPETV
jgi:DNA-binding PadR family transcriptional regulator